MIGFLFEMLIVPFPRNPSEHLFSDWIITLFHIGVASLTYLIFFSLVGLFVDGNDWKVGKELVAVFGLLLLIGIGEWGIRPIIYSTERLEFKHLVEEVWHAYLSGGLIFLLVVLVNANFLTKKDQRDPSGFLVPAMETSESQLKIETQNASDDFMLNPNDFVCTKAEGNYVLIFVKTEVGYRSELKRITLQSFCDQLIAFKYIFQTHRGFAVNLRFVEEMKGNAQGYQLKVRGVDFTIPVSRKHVAAFKALMEA